MCLAALGDIGVLTETVQPILWERVKVDVGEGTVTKKVYFDNASHQSGRQRGWINCSFPCRCVKYEFVTESEKAAYCAWMYVWEQHGNDAADRREHLKFDPRPADVAECMLNLRMVPF